MGLRSRGTALSSFQSRIASMAVIALIVACLVATVPSGGLVKVIVLARSGELEAAAHAVQAAGGSIQSELTAVGGLTARVEESELPVVASDASVLSVTPNATLKLLSNSTGPYNGQQDSDSLFNLENDIGVRTVWNHDTGSGIGVALIDSGVSPVEGLDNPGQVIQGPDLTEESQNPSLAHLDTFGHGTFMAGIIAGHDPGVDPATNEGNSAAFLGVAPDATVVSVKVADSHGMTDVSQVIAGIDWVVQNAKDPGLNIRVLNLSFGTDSNQSYLVDPLAYAAEVAWKAGIVVVVSAGNDGTRSDGLTDPADDPYILAVGADSPNGPSPNAAAIPSFSSWGNGTRNPDIVAPGAHVQSLADPGSYVDGNFGSTGSISSRFFRGSGTSEAAAFVSGCAALLIQEYPNFTPDQIKAVLVSTANRIPAVSPQVQGAGVINFRSASGPVSGSTEPSAVATPQSFRSSTGTGTLAAARGTDTITLKGVTLSGSTDIMGNAVNTAQLATEEADGTAWNGGEWNGVAWAGSSWSGSSWSTRTWTGDDWSGSSWSSDDWSSGTWTGSSWSDASWLGSSWSGSSWSGSSWSTGAWLGGVWATESWS